MSNEVEYGSGCRAAASWPHMCAWEHSIPFLKDTRALYLVLRAHDGSHVADLCHGGTSIAWSSRPLVPDLVSVCERRKNMVPILGDATSLANTLCGGACRRGLPGHRPEEPGEHHVEEHEGVRAKTGMLALKARCET